MAAPTWQDLYNLGAAQAQLLTPELLLLPGDASDMLIASGASIGDRIVGFGAEEFRKTYLDGAEGDDLTTLCDDHWNIQRFGASFASGSIILSRPTAGAGAGIVAAGSVFATQKDPTGKEIQVSNDVDVSFGSSDLGPHTVNAHAVAAGAQGNVRSSPFPVNRVITALFDSSIVVAQTGNFAGGIDGENDPDLRERTRNFSQALRRGTLAALEYGAKTQFGVATATAIEDAGGIVTVYIADADGNSSPALVTAVQLVLEDWRAAGALVYAAGGILDPTDVTVTIGARVGFDVAANTPLIVAAITTAMGKLKIGDLLYRDLIQGAARSVDPLNILSVTVSAPLANPLVPASGHVIRANTVTVQ